MQGAEIEDEGSVLKYMTKSEIEKQRSSLLVMTQRLVYYFLLGNEFKQFQTIKKERNNLSFGCPMGLEPTTFRTTIWDLLISSIALVTPLLPEDFPRF